MSLFQMDQNISNWIIGERTDFFNVFFSYVTDLGSAKFILLMVLIVAGLFYVQKKWYHIEVLFFAILLQEIVGKGLKHLIGRARPSEINFLVPADGYSFPSGHSLAAATFYGALIYFILISSFSRSSKIILTSFLTILIVLIGFSRVYLGVHYPGDVLGGFLLGIGCLIFTIRIVPKNHKNVVK